MTRIRCTFHLTMLTSGALLASGCGTIAPSNAASGNENMASEQAQSARSHYRDGTYVASGLYGGKPSKLTVTATLVADRLTDVQVRTHATDPTSLDYQRRFAAAVPGVVKGKSLDQVQVGKLAGASGCPDGFNAAIAKIREAARQP
jgi:uncharacterized protein with FMN-binding domain